MTELAYEKKVGLSSSQNPPQTKQHMLLIIQGTSAGKLGLAACIQRQGLVLRMNTSAMRGSDHPSIMPCHEVSGLQLGGIKGQHVLHGFDAPFGTNITVPRPLFVMMPVDHKEVCIRVGRADI